MELEIMHSTAYITNPLRRKVVEPYRLQLLLPLCLRTLLQGVGAVERLP